MPGAPLGPGGANPRLQLGNILVLKPLVYAMTKENQKRTNQKIVIGDSGVALENLDEISVFFDEISVVCFWRWP